MPSRSPLSSPKLDPGTPNQARLWRQSTGKSGRTSSKGAIHRSTRPWSDEIERELSSAQRLLHAVLVARHARNESAGQEARGKAGKSLPRHVLIARPDPGLTIARKRARQNVAGDLGKERRRDIGKVLDVMRREPVLGVANGAYHSGKSGAAAR